jgi:hypothetical protein
MVEEEEEACLFLPKDFDPRAMPIWLLPPPSAEILFRGPPNLVVSQQQQPLSSDSSLSWETFVSWPPERRRMRRMQGRRENENENLSAKSIVFFNNNNDDDENENENDDEEERVEFALDERWAKRFAETELKRRERRKAREREKREEQPVSGRVERARAKAEETMRTWEALE